MTITISRAHFPARLALAALLAFVLAPGCGSSECDTFYDTYEECGFADPGEDVDARRKSCKERTSGNEACETDYKAMNLCIGKLDDACGYPDNCGDYLTSAYYHCGY